MLPKLPEVIFIPSFLNKEMAVDCFNELKNTIEFKTETYNFADKVVESKRKIAYIGDNKYSYSNQVYAGDSWHPLLLSLKELVEEAVTAKFNAVLCNYYENGEAGMGWHADKEKELGDKPIIASLSLGEARRFAFRHRREVVNMKNPPRLVEYTLNSGDLLVMVGDTQKFFEHSVIKDKSAKGERINLTFRKVVTV